MKKAIKPILMIILFLIVLVLGNVLLQQNFTYMIKYWGTLLILGITTFPMTSLIMNKFDDKGWAFSKIIGTAIPAVILWNLSYLKILKFTQTNAYIIIGVIAIINLIILIVKKDKFKDLKQKWSNIAVIELLFFILFIVWLYIRSFVPEINSATEQFMNYGFMNKLMNSEYLPIEDIWLSGNSINYYYFGHYISAFLSKISFTGVEETYNLMMALIAAFIFVLTYSIGKNLGNSLIKNSTKKSASKIPIIIAVFVALALSIGGTLHYTIHRLVLRESDYFYADPYHYIGTNPDTNDIGIICTPSYMNVEGDLHAHHLDTMFVLTTLALLLQYMLSDNEKSKLNKFLNPNIILLGIMLGIQTMTNYWDFPIYFVIISAVVAVKNFIKYKKTKEKMLMTLLNIGEIILLQIVTTFLFSKNLYMSATKIYFTGVMSPFYKLLVLWGLPTLCILIEIFTELYKYLKERKIKENGTKAKKDKTKSIFAYIGEMNLADIYVIILGICAIGLVIVPEIIYLKDIYTEEYKRANTMFKLTYNSSILFSITTSYILIKQLSKDTKIWNTIIICIIMFVYLTTFGYGLNAINYATKGFIGETYDIKANAEKYIANKLPDDYKAIQWIKQNINRDDVILELPGGSFNDYSIISVFTANPTVLGWHGHEWVWRAKPDYSAPDEEQERWNAIYYMYKTATKEQLKDYIEKYNISYIYIGNVEFQEIENVNLEALLSMGEIVYEQTENYTLTPVYLVKVK